MSVIQHHFLAYRLVTDGKSMLSSDYPTRI